MTDRHQQARLRRLSKFLSLLLRHRPNKFPIPLDAAGYADLREVMRILKGLPNFRWATRTDIDAVLNMPGRQRYELVTDSDGHERIRALYGHTAIRPTYPAVAPPDVLYHGTAPDNLDAIQHEGLQPMARQYVHLATDQATARSIALRHTYEPVILHINAAAAHTDGHTFYHPIANIYLTETLPSQYISYPIENQKEDP